MWSNTFVLVGGGGGGGSLNLNHFCYSFDWQSIKNEPTGAHIL